jgi:hypothetical protein
MEKEQIIVWGRSSFFRRLADYGGYPASWWTPASFSHQGGNNPDSPVICHDIDEWLGVLQESSTDRTYQAFASLADRVVCHIVSLGGGHAVETSIIEFYRRLDGLAEQALEHHSHGTRFVLIVLCFENTSPDDILKLQNWLDSLDEEALWRPRRCYVMQRRLELMNRRVHFADYVWPIPVADLILRLHADSRDLHGVAEMRAWRSLRLAMTGSGPQPVHEGISAGEDIRNWLEEDGKDRAAEWTQAYGSAGHARPGVPKIPPDLATETGDPEGWLDFRAEKRLEQSFSPRTWSQVLEDEDSKLSIEIAKESFEQQRQIDLSMRSFWESFHRLPGLMNRVLAWSEVLDEEEVRIPSLEEMQDTLVDETDLETKKRASLYCAREYDSAAVNLLPLTYRLFCSICVALLVLNMTLTVIYLVEGVNVPMFVIASAAVLCAVALPSFLLHRLEIFRIKKAYLQILDYRDQGVEAIRNLYVKTRELSTRSAHVRSQRRVVSSIQHLDTMVRRTREIFHDELDGVEAYLRPPDEEEEQDTDFEERLATFRNVVNVNCRMHDFSGDPVAADERHDLHEQLTASWRTCWTDQDREYQGFMPAERLRALVREMKSTVESHRIRQTLQVVFSNSHKDLRGPWEEGIRERTGETFLTLMSCRFERAQLPHPEDVVEYLFWGENVLSAIEAPVDTHEPRLTRSPEGSVALLWHEVGVRFAGQEDGTVRVDRRTK